MLDKEICDEYISDLEGVDRFKNDLKDCKRLIKNMDEIVKQIARGNIAIKASLMVRRELIRRYKTTEDWLTFYARESKKSTKKYQQYCEGKQNVA